MSEIERMQRYIERTKYFEKPLDYGCYPCYNGTILKKGGSADVY